MRVGLLINRIDGDGGIQRNYRLWYELFKKKGLEVYLFVLNQSQLTKIDDKNIIFVDSISNLFRGIKLHQEIKKIGKFDLFLVNAEYMRPYLPKKEVSNYYITVHNTWSKTLKQGLRRVKKLRKITKKYKNENIIGISQSVIDDITKNLQIPIKSQRVIYAPHNFKNVKKLAQEIEIDDNYIVSVGGLSKRKNYPLLINAFAKLSDKNLKLFIIGRGSQEESLKELIKELKLEDRVKLLGFRENPYPYIKNAKALVSSSLSEGLPRVIVEAMILDTPIVTTKSSEGIYEVMQGELTKFISSYSEDDLVSKIEMALKDYPEIKKEYYQKFDEDYSFEEFMKLTSN